MPTVTERTLSLQLKALEEDGLIKRKIYTSKPPLKVEYSLIDFGKTLIPLIQSIANWGIMWQKIILTDFYSLLRSRLSPVGGVRDGDLSAKYRFVG